MSIANATETLLLNWLFNQGTPTRPTAFYLSIHSADPTEDGSVGEQVVGTDTNYSARPTLTFGSAAASGVISNTAALTYTPAVAAPDFTVTYVAIWDAATAGNCLFVGALEVARTINNGSPLSFAIGDINVALD